MRKQVGLISGLVVVVVAGWLLLANKQSQSALKIFTDSETGAVFSYPAEAKILGLSKEDQATNIIFRASQSEQRKEAYLITLRFEKDLQLVTNVTRQDALTMLTKNAERAFPGRYQHYTEVSERRLNIGGRQAAELIFIYNSPAGVRVKERFIILLRDEDLAVYLALQSKQGDFDKLNKLYFEPIIKSLHFQS